MQLEDYFEFLSPDEIRVKGHRVWIEHILYEYIYRTQTAEEIAQRFDTLTLEQVYAAILYYLHNKEAMNKYMADWMEYCRTSREESRQKHPEFYAKMRRLKASCDRRVVSHGEEEQTESTISYIQVTDRR